MITAAIEKEILIEAPIEDVWRLLTEPAYMRQWFADDAEIELRLGGKGEIEFKEHGAYQLQVAAVEPLRRFAFRWVSRAGLTLRDDNSLLVEFFLRPENGGTRLRVVESGFDAIDWSDEDKASYVESHADGWVRCLDQIRDLARTQPTARE